MVKLKVKNEKCKVVESLRDKSSSVGGRKQFYRFTLYTLNFTLFFAAALSGVAKTFDVDISTGRPAAANEAYYHGETIEFRAVRGRTVVTNIEYGCIYYQTNGMDSVWWHTDGLVFHPTNDVGAASYRFFLEGRDDLGRDWHANGLLRLLPSPGFTPNTIELPVARLDFSHIEVANAPYYDKTETEAKIVELAPAPGDYAAVSNAAMNAAITNALQDVAIESLRVNIASNAVAISTLSDAKLDKRGDEFTVSHTANGLRIADNAGVYYVDVSPSGVSTSYPDGQPHNVAWPNSDGTLALTSDIPTVPTAQINAATTTNALQDAAIAEKQGKLPYPTNAIPYAAISGKPSLATVATSGSYNDLSNKPTIPTVPTDVSAFNNDAGYLTGYTETDPTISAWAKAANKPTYTASEVGATTPEDVTAAIREQSLGGIWDAELEVWWTPRMRNGNLTYEATTNVNLNAGN